MHQVPAQKQDGPENVYGPAQKRPHVLSLFFVAKQRYFTFFGVVVVRRMDDADDDFRDIQVNAAAVSVLQRRQSGAAANARPGGTDDTESDRCFDRTSDSEGISDSSHGPRSTSSFNSASTKELAALNVTLSDDDDSVAKLSLNDNALNSFAVKQMAAASAATADAADVDAFSSGDPFDNLTDSESGAARSVAAADDDSRMIHSLAERGEFLLDDLVDGFVQVRSSFDVVSRTFAVQNCEAAHAAARFTGSFKYRFRVPSRFASSVSEHETGILSDALVRRRRRGTMTISRVCWAPVACRRCWRRRPRL